MKKLFLACIMMILFAVPAWANDLCFNCPKKSPCVASTPLGWGNVIGVRNVWCINGQWYTDGAATILPVIGVEVPIANPFEVK